MWHNNLAVSRTYSSNDSQNAWAIIDTLPGWKKIRPNATDGVTNMFVILCAAKANGRRVDVYIDSNQIARATLR